MAQVLLPFELKYIERFCVPIKKVRAIEAVPRIDGYTIKLLVFILLKFDLVLDDQRYVPIRFCRHPGHALRVR